MFKIIIRNDSTVLWERKCLLKLANFKDKKKLAKAQEIAKIQNFAKVQKFA